MTVSRRKVLGFLGTGIGTALLVACGQAAPSPTAAPAAKPTEAPKPAPAEPKAPTAAPSTPAPTASSVAPTAVATKPAVTGPTPTATVAASVLNAKPGKQTVEIWHQYGSAPGRPLLLSMLGKFNETTGIGINESQNAGGDLRIQQKFIAAAAAGTPPDVYNTSKPLVWAGRGTLATLTDYAKRDGVVVDDKIWFPNPSFLAQFEGSLYSLPYDTDSRGIFWNKKHFAEVGLDPEKPPKTWSELKTYSQKLMKKDGDKIVRIGFSPLFGESHNWGYIGQAGGYPIIDWSPKPPKIRLNTPEAIKAYQFMLELVDLNGGVTQLRAFQQGFQTGISHPFLTGQVSMIYQGSWYPTQIKSFKPDMQYERDYGIAQQPLADGITAPFSMTGGWHYTVAKGAKHKDEAWEFVKWFGSDDQLLWWNRDIGNIPPKRKVTEDKFYSAMPMKFFIEQMPYARGWPSDQAWWFRDVKYSVETALDEILFKKREAKDALTQANDELQQVAKEVAEGKR